MSWLTLQTPQGTLEHLTFLQESLGILCHWLFLKSNFIIQLGLTSISNWTSYISILITLIRFIIQIFRREKNGYKSYITFWSGSLTLLLNNMFPYLWIVSNQSEKLSLKRVCCCRVLNDYRGDRILPWISSISSWISSISISSIPITSSTNLTFFFLWFRWSILLHNRWKNRTFIWKQRLLKLL